MFHLLFLLGIVLDLLSLSFHFEYLLLNRLLVKYLLLHDILSEERYSGEDGADEIERTIHLLQKTVSFDVPLLLKPIFDIKNPDSIFLTCMQSGAVNEQIKTMIELGIPRETALYLYEAAFKGKKEGSDKKENLEQKIRNRLENIIETLRYWVEVQVDFLI